MNDRAARPGIGLPSAKWGIFPDTQAAPRESIISREVLPLPLAHLRVACTDAPCDGVNGKSPEQGTTRADALLKVFRGCIAMNRAGRAAPSAGGTVFRGELAEVYNL
ncbi:alpha/beta hydrolase [Anopheles sinensis]|uniref:Alpha/beta hydrolase n=1 Tax=Anopheles sinensis TaxID=74873 RepID=A0A084W277_ANOSI|nr:alpha/beta hydrolase [Anopheles sinensis]